MFSNVNNLAIQSYNTCPNIVIYNACVEKVALDIYGRLMSAVKIFIVWSLRYKFGDEIQIKFNAGITANLKTHG